MSVPKTEKALTLEQFIEQLSEIRQEIGGAAPVLMADGEPVTLAEAGRNGECLVVYITDFVSVGEDEE